MKLSNKKSIQQQVLTLVALGLKNVVIAPGSRNAPFTISFHQHPQIDCISIRDERSAAFFALGLALETKNPVALLSTSGTAVLNFAPAIAEAFYLRLPLIVITADRPLEWTGQMDGQTIDQKDIYKNYIRKSYSLNGDTEDKNQLWYNNRSINEGWAIATKIDPGPVHFNVPFNEPLFNSEVPDEHVPKIVSVPDFKLMLNEEEKQNFQRAYTHSQKVMVLAGQHEPDVELSKLLITLSKNSNTIILSENTTNINHPDFITNIDRCIMPLEHNEVAQLMPDLLITIGGAIVSKKIKEYLRKFPPDHHWNIHLHDSLVDTYQSLTHAVPIKSKNFLSQLLENIPEVKTSHYKNQWLTRFSLVKEKHSRFMEQAAFSDLSVFAKIYQYIPQDLVVHFSNSSPIRYAQLFDNSVLRRVHCNRGTSGIDGCTSTMMGAAYADPSGNYLLITGDVAFFYDNNAFWNESLPKNCKVILINNQGGGIFRIIKGPDQTEELEHYFETKHSISAKKMVEFYGWKYYSAHDAETVENNLQMFFQRDTGNAVLEIFTPNEVNSPVLANYFSFLANKEK